MLYIRNLPAVVIASVVVLLSSGYDSCSAAKAVSLSQVQPYRGDNIAMLSRGGSVRASSWSGTSKPENAFDNVSWHFQAWFPDSWRTDPDKAPWIERKLDQMYTVGRIVTRTTLSPQRCSFRIAVSSNGTSWTEVASFQNVSDEVVAKFTPVRARYIRTTFVDSADPPVIYEQMAYEAITNGRWSKEPGVQRRRAGGVTVVYRNTETVAVCGEPLEACAAIEHGGTAGPSRDLKLTCDGARISAKQLSDGVVFTVTGSKPGKRALKLYLRYVGQWRMIAKTVVDFLPSPDPSRLKPFFPLGVFYATRPQPIGSEAWRQATDRDFPVIKELGANCVILGPFTPNPAEPRWAEYLTLLDGAQRHGLKLLIPIWDFAVATSKVEDMTLTDLYPQVKSTVEAVSRHPALLGYYLFDEPMPWYARNVHTLERLLRSLDPSHPAVAVFTSPVQMKNAIPGAGLRVNLIDVYPVAADRALGDIAYKDAFVTGDKVAFGNLMQRIRALAPRQPFWLIPQAFGEGGLRLPEAAELRQMCWLAISRGFTGIIPFVLSTNLPDDSQIGLLGAGNRRTLLYDEVFRLFQDLAPIAGELARVSGVGTPIQVSGAADARVFTTRDGIDYAVIVNRSAVVPVEAIAHIPHSNDIEVRDMRSGAQLVPFGDRSDQFRVHLEPGGGTVLRIKR